MSDRKGDFAGTGRRADKTAHISGGGIKKNDEIIVEIDDMGTHGEGIGHVDGYALFVKEALPGEIVRVRIMKLNKNYGFARMVEILRPSASRVEPRCPSASACGGCTLLHLSYEGQLAYKEKKVRDCLVRLGGVNAEEIQWLPILGAAAPDGAWHYRNKAQFPVRMAEGEDCPAAGFFAGHSHRLVPVDDCQIQHPIMNQAVRCVLDFMKENKISAYDENSHRGLVRHIYVRRGYVTGEVMVCLVIHGNSLPCPDYLVKALREIPGMASISLNINRERTNVILGKKMIPLWGPLYIEDCIGGIRYRISPQSFYQVNPVQTEKLYQTVLDFADLQGDEEVWDLYCGIGTISLFLARRAAHVTGVEIVPEAVENAKINAKLNGITNVDFFCGAAEQVVGELAEQIPQKLMGKPQNVYGDKARVVVVDPPRKGCDAALLDTIVRLAPEKVVYVSCNPATLARDVKILGERGYRMEKVRACDMFPGGEHVETVVQLVNIGVKPDYTVRVDVDVDEMYKTIGEDKRNYIHSDEYKKIKESWEKKK